jgi:MoaA/NifB/PqqE/SkfB family radical SAM enzyme
MLNFLQKIKRKILGDKVGDCLICSEIFESMSILADGSVSCGCLDIFDGRNLGNVNNQSLMEIFDGPQFRELRCRMISGDLPPQCVKCPLRIRPRSGKESIEAAPLKWIQIDPIFNCNLRCPDCAFTEMRESNFFIRPRTAISLETFKSIVDQASGSLEHIRFHLLGEPFLNKHSMDMLNYAKKKIPDIFISIETNGILLVPEMQDSLVDAGVDYVKFSIDGACQESYKKYRVGGQFQKAYDNMISLIRKRNEAGADRPKVLWQYILFKWNDSDEEIKKARKFAAEGNVDELYWLITHTSSASERFLPGGVYPEFEAPGESIHETIEIVAARGKPVLRPAPNLNEYDPWK